jgi:DNA-binding CsgD family transcriptional regulator
MCEYSLAEAGLTRFDIAPDAPAWLRNLKPRVLLPYVVHDMAITISEVRRYDELPDETIATHLRLRLLKTFSTLGRAAVIVDAAGVVRYSNPAADILLASESARPGSRLRPARATDRDALEAAIVAATKPRPAQPPDSLVFSRAAGLAPLIVRVLPVDEMLAGAGHALLLLSDPSRPSVTPQAAASLELLGLTPAEARLAAIVGQGSAPRRAARDLGIAESTARTVLRTVYEKLAIRKQSQLANLVTRLDGT